MIRVLAAKLLQKSLSFLASREPEPADHEYDTELEEPTTTMVREDVEEGYFAVFAVKGDEIQRFVVELCCLEDPEFLKLLKQAEEEYGFEQKGALIIPCRPQDLQKVLQDPREM